MTSQDLLTLVNKHIDHPLTLQDDVFDHGLSSLSLITIVEELTSRGLPADFFLFSTRPTVGGWAEILGISG